MLGLMHPDSNIGLKPAQFKPLILFQGLDMACCGLEGGIKGERRFAVMLRYSVVAHLL
jgi:hypothetical protein